MKQAAKVLAANLSISVAFWTMVVVFCAWLDGAM